VDDTWKKRKTFLKKDAPYRVITTTSSVGGDNFIQGENLRLLAVYYSPYDGSHVYEFEDGDGRRKSYWLHDGDPIERLTIFEMDVAKMPEYALRLRWKKRLFRHGYEVRVRGHTWVLKMNDFPDEPLYSFYVDGQRIGDFSDWPPSWEKR
jgi:hypothetical protein